MWKWLSPSHHPFDFAGKSFKRSNVTVSEAGFAASSVTSFSCGRYSNPCEKNSFAIPIGNSISKFPSVWK
jgi:hypothetical protein